MLMKVSNSVRELELVLLFTHYLKSYGASLWNDEYECYSMHAQIFNYIHGQKTFFL